MKQLGVAIFIWHQRIVYLQGKIAVKGLALRGQFTIRIGSLRYDCHYYASTFILKSSHGKISLTEEVRRKPFTEGSSNQPSEMTKKCLACICALPFSIPSMCCLREYSSTPGSIEKSKKRRDFFDFWSAALQLDGAACPLCPPTINHISEVLSLLRWPLYTTHIITISPHSKTFIIYIDF